MITPVASEKTEGSIEVANERAIEGAKMQTTESKDINCWSMMLSDIHK